MPPNYVSRIELAVKSNKVLIRQRGGINRRNVGSGGRNDRREVSGDAIALGPFLHILDHGEQPCCVLDLKYDVASRTFRAVDNQLCGGFNVTFDGVWHQTTSKN